MRPFLYRFVWGETPRAPERPGETSNTRVRSPLKLRTARSRTSWFRDARLRFAIDEGFFSACRRWAGTCRTPDVYPLACLQMRWFVRRRCLVTTSARAGSSEISWQCFLNFPCLMGGAAPSSAASTASSPMPASGSRLVAFQVASLSTSGGLSVAAIVRWEDVAGEPHTCIDRQGETWRVAAKTCGLRRDRAEQDDSAMAPTNDGGLTDDGLIKCRRACVPAMVSYGRMLVS